jgi:catechol 2,3-dioxygenase-like lactoylglutathione lyase family enzyme
MPTTRSTGTDTPQFTGGVNIAMKIPRQDYEPTVTFYRDVLGLAVTSEPSGTPSVPESHRVAFGPNILWLDRVDHGTRAELFLQLQTSHLDRATARLADHGTSTCDEVEQLPAEAHAHWIRNPAGVVHLLIEDEPPT